MSIYTVFCVYHKNLCFFFNLIFCFAKTKLSEIDFPDNKTHNIVYDGSSISRSNSIDVQLRL